MSRRRRRRRRRRHRRPWREREASSTMTWEPAPSVASVARRRGRGWREARPAGVPRARANLPWARTREGTVRRRRDGELAVPRVGREPTRRKDRLERRESGTTREPRARATSFVSHVRTAEKIRKVASKRVSFCPRRRFRGCRHRLFALTSTGTRRDGFSTARKRSTRFYARKTGRAPAILQVRVVRTDAPVEPVGSIGAPRRARTPAPRLSGPASPRGSAHRAFGLAEGRLP
jgi:hypothetical protein